MKKYLLLLVSLFLLTGCSHTCSKLTPSGIETIDYKTLNQYLKQDVTFMLLIGRDDCSDCYTLSQMIKTYTEDTNTGLYYFNLKEYEASVTDKEYKNIYKKFDFTDIPTLEVIKNGKITKQYTYLDESYFKIKDRKKQKQERENYNKKFVSFMNDYYEVDYEMS